MEEEKEPIQSLSSAHIYKRIKAMMALNGLGVDIEK